MSLQIPPSEYQSRAERLLQFLRQERLAGVVVFDNFYILYYTGFAFIPTERPMAFAMNANGERVLFVPRLEFEHAKSQARVDRVESYIEYPDNPHPMKRFAEILGGLGLKGKIGVDNDGYPPILGYQGDSLSLTGAQNSSSIVLSSIS
jgi:Xaa-Pro aminopeptidase